MAAPLNFVFIMVDTQNKSMVGAYGDPTVDTPHLDRLAESGIRFERAYDACPLCTPARGAIFSGLHPQVNGAWTNNMAPSANIPLMGRIFSHYGFRTAYTGKWHLDGGSYFGDGVPGGGFEPDWWYDGKRYADDIGPDMFRAYARSRTADDLRTAGFSLEKIWAHRVATRAVDFLDKVGEDPFVLAVSFDEPHGPSVAPPEYWEKFSPEDIPKPSNFNAPIEKKPGLQQTQRRQNGDVPWEKFARRQTHFFGCNSYLDREIGRVIDAVEARHAKNTVLIYTSDHGDMIGAHGLLFKGPMMYEETTNVPFLVRLPGGPSNAVSRSLVSHLDIIPTMLDLAGLPAPERLHGRSLAPILQNPSASVREHALINFHRFAINHDQFGEFYPIRCLVGERYKLNVNLFDTDEFYDLEEDPREMINRIDDPSLAQIRKAMHAELLAEMDRIRDPFRSFRWGDRPWNSIRDEFYWGGANRPAKPGFPFEPKGAGE